MEIVGSNPTSVTKTIIMLEIQKVLDILKGYKRVIEKYEVMENCNTKFRMLEKYDIKFEAVASVLGKRTQTEIEELYKSL